MRSSGTGNGGYGGRGGDVGSHNTTKIYVMKNKRRVVVIERKRNGKISMVDFALFLLIVSFKMCLTPLLNDML